MRLAGILVATSLLLGGVTACSDHYPTVVFTGDAGVDGKGGAGTSLDGGGNHDGGTATEVAVATDGGGPVVDVSLPVDQASQSNPTPDAATSVDAVVGPAVDGSTGTSLEVGIDSSAVHDGGGTAG